MCGSSAANDKENLRRYADLSDTILIELEEPIGVPLTTVQPHRCRGRVLIVLARRQNTARYMTGRLDLHVLFLLVTLSCNIKVALEPYYGLVDRCFSHDRPLYGMGETEKLQKIAVDIASGLLTPSEFLFLPHYMHEFAYVMRGGRRES